MFSGRPHIDKASGSDAQTHVLSGTQSGCTSYHKYHIYNQRHLSSVILKHAKDLCRCHIAFFIDSIF